MKILYLIFVLILIFYNDGSKAQRPSGSLDTLVNGVFTPQPGGVTPTKNPNQAVIQPPKPPSYSSCGDNKVCVPFYNCKNTTGTINEDGENIIDIRIDGDCPYLEKCCGLNDKSLDENGKLEPPPTPVFKQSCGNRNGDGVLFKITGDKHGETEYAEFPWIIAVLKQETAGDEILNLYQCGGSLIHPQVILTAAHCVYKSNAFELIARAGEWDTQTKDEIYPEQDRLVIEIVTHEKFKEGGLHNDVALLITAQPFNLSIHVNTVCLPPPTVQFGESRCYAIGWGKDVFGQKGKYQVILKKIDLPIVQHDVCQERLRGTRLGKFFNLHPSFICAGGEPGKDTCKGDGGSPLSCPIPGEIDRFYQTGIVAWGIGCGGASPGVYASVQYLRGWIDNAMQSRNFDSSYYTA